MYKGPLKIGTVTLENNIILAPMAGVTDLPFRLLCKEQGAGLVCMEMVSAKAIYYKNKNTERLLTIDPREGPVSLQLFGSEPELMGEMAKRIEERPFDILDINMGCPVPKVVNNGEGSALMRDPVLAGKIVAAVAKAVKKPVTVKLRLGFDAGHINVLELAKIAEDAGAAAVAIHGRTREQYYSGKADWEMIARVKEALAVPVIGNGDIFRPEDAGRMLRETGCDGVMIARGARGNPWIFAQVRAYLEESRNVEPAAPSIQELREMILRHAVMQVACKGEYTGVREMRKHVAWYTAGIPHSARLRRKVNEICSLGELEELLQKELDCPCEGSLNSH